jgi:hypothetical protein
MVLHVHSAAEHHGGQQEFLVSPLGRGTSGSTIFMGRLMEAVNKIQTRTHQQRDRQTQQDFTLRSRFNYSFIT